MALTDFINGKNVKPFSQSIKIQIPVFGTVRSIVGPKVTAVEQDDNWSVTLVEIARSDAVHIDEFFSRHALPPCFKTV
jgi:hypothetical protein